MSLSDFHPSVTKEKSSFSQPKMASSSYDLSYMNDECVELLWDNDPTVVMQGDPNRPRKSSFQTAFPPFGSRVQEKDACKFNPFAKIEHFRATEPKSNNFPLSGPSSSIEKINAQDEDFVPWINYPIEESLHSDYCSGFLNDYSGINMNSIHSQSNILATAIRSSSLDQSVFRNSHNVEQENASKTSRNRACPLFQLTPLFPSEVEVGIGSSAKDIKERGDSGAMNSIHFYRPVAHSRTSLEEDVDKFMSSKAMFATSSNLIGSSVIECSKMSNVICEDISRSKPYSRSPERIQSSSFAASVALGRHETDKGNNEALLASSSMCSDSNAGRAISEHKQWDKKKHLEGEESGYQTDEDPEEKFMELKKTATHQGKSKKRSRAAEVHNLSERRRRDRINEKMRALQELIPNCNKKTDKASMLDEAIEYLKYLQLQVQIMSTASGLCVSPVIMQQVQQAPRTAHYLPMGMGMGMGIGLGYSMGLYDMNGSPGHSFIQVPPIQGPQGLQQMSMSGILGQGFVVTMPYQPPSSLANIKITAVAGTNSEHHQKQKKTLEKLENLNTGDLQIQSTKAVRNGVKNSSMTQLSDQPSLTSI